MSETPLPNAQRPRAASQPEARPLKWMILAALSAGLNLILGLLIGFLALGLTSDPYSKGIDYTWAYVGMPVSAMVIASAIASVLCLGFHSARLQGATTVLLITALCGLAALAFVGVLVTNEVSRRGGDWAALGVAASVAFGILFPGVVWVLSALNLLAVWRIARHRGRA
jgi:hypothetical protein